MADLDRGLDKRGNKRDTGAIGFERLFSNNENEISLSLFGQTCSVNPCCRQDLTPL